MQTFHPSYKQILRLVWLVQGIIVIGMVALNLVGFWLAGNLQGAWMGVAAILAIAVTASLIITPALRRFLTLELDAQQIVTLGVLKPMFTMRWDEIDEVRAGNMLGLNAVSLSNKRTGKQVGFYLLTEDRAGLAAALREYTPANHPLRRYADLYLK